MDITITGRKTEIKDTFRDVVEDKKQRIETLAPEGRQCKIVLSGTGNPRMADIAMKVEITVDLNGKMVRAEATGPNDITALDMAVDKLAAILRRLHSRRVDYRRGARSTGEISEPVASVEDLKKALEEDKATRKEARMASELPSVHSLTETTDDDTVSTEIGDVPITIRRKIHPVEKMTISQALDQLELLGHDFYMFVNSETQRPAIVYRRHGWSYGVLEFDASESKK